MSQIRRLAQPLLDRLHVLFPKVTSKAKNTAFLRSVQERFDGGKWKALTKLLNQAIALVEGLAAGGDDDEERVMSDGKRKTNGSAKGKSIPPAVRQQWRAFAVEVKQFQAKADALSGKFAFSFVDGVLVQALKQGHWLLIDEINLAPAETLERLSGLLESPAGSVVLTERGDILPVERHPDFRLFACMNPPTDVGKKDLPDALRSRSTSRP